MSKNVFVFVIFVVFIALCNQANAWVATIPAPSSSEPPIARLAPSDKQFIPLQTSCISAAKAPAPTVQGILSGQTSSMGGIGGQWILTNTCDHDLLVEAGPLFSDGSGVVNQAARLASGQSEAFSQEGGDTIGYYACPVMYKLTIPPNTNTIVGYNSNRSFACWGH